MDEHDRKNLQFLLNASEATIRDWWGKITDDDRQYAAELLQAHAAELREQSTRLRTVLEVERINIIDGALRDSDLSDARAVLAQFRL